MFQQRDAWGSRQDRLDPYKSARMFFLGGQAGQRGLMDFANRDQMSIGQAAQSVQVSAFPDRYAQHAAEAGQILSNLGNFDTKAPGTLGAVPGPPDATDTTTTTHDTTIPTLNITPSQTTEVNGLGEITADANGIGGVTAEGSGVGESTFDTLAAPRFGGPTADPMERLKMPTAEEAGLVPPTGDTAAGWRAAIVAAARKMLGTPYVWGGTSYNGVDCSGLIKLLYGKQGFNVPRLSADQARLGKRVGLDQLKPGDLVGWDNSSRNVGADHIAIYIGDGKIIEAPRPGGVVQVSSLYDTGEAWGVALNF
jgi:cell wall-associated NlpC family hydrolase